MQQQRNWLLPCCRPLETQVPNVWNPPARWSSSTLGAFLEKMRQQKTPKRETSFPLIVERQLGGEAKIKSNFHLTPLPTTDNFRTPQCWSHLKMRTRHLKLLQVCQLNLTKTQHPEYQSYPWSQTVILGTRNTKLAHKILIYVHTCLRQYPANRCFPSESGH